MIDSNVNESLIRTYKINEHKSEIHFYFFTVLQN